MTISQERREQLRETVYAAIQATTTGPFWPDMLTALDELEAAEARATAAEQERDLAIAHDRQPYPTAWAYEQACRVLNERTAERDALQAQRDAVLVVLDNWPGGLTLGQRVLAVALRAVLTDPPKAGDQ